MKRDIKIISLILFLIVVGFLILVAYSSTPSILLQNKSKENLTTGTPSVMEFLPLTLCKKTGGEWRAVSAKEYPLNESEGVYSPTTNNETNYKCFCPEGKKWIYSEGCV